MWDNLFLSQHYQAIALTAKLKCDRTSTKTKRDRMVLRSPTSLQGLLCNAR
jgi:hypothetical protein